MEIREAIIKDKIPLSHLITELGYKTSSEEMGNRLNNIFGNPDYKTVVAVENEELVGMIGMMKSFYYERNGFYIRIVAIIVKKDYRRKGVASKFLEIAENWAKVIGATAIILNCGNRDERIEAHKFYESSGFAAVSTGYYKTI